MPYFCRKSKEEVTKIKVLRIIHRFSISGPPFHVALLTKYLGKNFDTKLIGGVPDEGEADSFYVLEKYEVQATIIPELRRSVNFFSDIKAYFKIKKIIKEYKPDIVHTHASKAGALGRFAAYNSGAKIIVHTYHGHVFHSYFGKFKTSIYKFVERYLAKKTTGIVAISESQKRELSDVFHICPKDKIEVIPLGLELDTFASITSEKRQAARERFGLHEEDFAIAIVGRLAPIKDHLFFLNVVEQLLIKSKHSLKIFIVGDGTEKEVIQRRANEINAKFPNSIHLTSWIREMAQVYHALDLVCLTSKNEGTPVTLIEAQAAALPVVSTDVGGVRDVVLDQVSGFVLPKDDLNGYVEKTLELINDPEKRMQFGAAGQKNMLEKYHYQRLIQDMEKYYARLLSKVSKPT